MSEILLIVSLGLAWVPLCILLLSAIHNINAKWLWKVFGIPSLITLGFIWFYSSQVGLPLASLIGWGIVSGIALTVALDIIRLAGVKLKTLPMDMPISFGLRATGLFEEVKKRMMAKRKEMNITVMPEELTMFGVAAMMKPIIMQVLTEKNAKAKVMFWGYVWHFLNGITFGLCYTLVVGSGHWLIALNWGVLVWVLMMLVMPAMMSGAKITPNIFFTALVAHIVMAIPLMYIPPAVLSIEATRNTLLAFLVKLIGI
jgi:hypothetical protein